MANAYDRYHALDPARFPRTSRTAYFFDPKEWLHVSREAEQRGETVTCVYHSHVDVGAYFSAEDMAMAAPDGEPLLPGVSYLVLDVRAGAARSGRLFWWEKDVFRDLAVAIPP
jgi:proteasome lid subunit RPN8/RPN11